MNKKQKETISDAITHLNRYVTSLEKKFSPALAVRIINELRGLLE